MTLVKIAFIVVIFLLAFGTGMIPIKCKGFKGNPLIIGIANAFSGGVFLAIALIHILPEVSESYHEWAHPDEHDHPEDEHLLRHGGDEEDKLFPLPNLLAFCGYAFILMVDKVMFDSHALIHGHDHGEGHGHGHGHEHKDHGDHQHSHGSTDSHQHKEGEHKHDHKHHGHDHKEHDNSLSTRKKAINNDEYYGDPAAQKLIANVKKSIIAAADKMDRSLNRADAKKSMIEEQENIGQSIKAYLSRNDQFAARMSAALSRSKIGNKSVASANKEQQNLFVD